MRKVSKAKVNKSKARQGKMANTSQGKDVKVGKSKGKALRCSKKLLKP